MEEEKISKITIAVGPKNLKFGIAVYSCEIQKH